MQGTAQFVKYDFFENPVSLLFPGDAHEIFAFADEARCFALGAQYGVGGAFDAQNQMLLDPNFAFGSAHKGHTAEFRSTNMKRAPFWNTFADVLSVLPQ